MKDRGRLNIRKTLFSIHRIKLMELMHSEKNILLLSNVSPVKQCGDG